MGDLQKAIDLIDEIDGMPFGQVPGALDRLRATLVLAQRQQPAATMAPALPTVTAVQPRSMRSRP